MKSFYTADFTTFATSALRTLTTIMQLRNVASLCIRQSCDLASVLEYGSRDDPEKKMAPTLKVHK